MIRTLAVTISPRNRVDKYNTLKWIFQNDASDICLLLRKCSKNFTIYPEFDVNSRLHYHGIVYVHDNIKWHKHTKPGLDKIGYTLIKEIKDYKNKDKWLTYCTKEWEDTQQILSIEHPLMWTYRPKKKHELYDECNRFIGYGFGYEKSDELLFVDPEDSSEEEVKIISPDELINDYITKDGHLVDNPYTVEDIERLMKQKKEKRSIAREAGMPAD